jgi:uncharacterized protein YlxW (UPF0749 family)
VRQHRSAVFINPLVQLFGLTVLDSRQSKAHTEEIQLLRKELYKIQEQQASQTNTISNLTNILKTDSLTKYFVDKF